MEESDSVLKTRAQKLSGETEETREILSENSWSSDGCSNRLFLEVKWYSRLRVTD